MKPQKPLRIDKNVPLPTKYPFKDMQVGDSFVIPAKIHRTTVSVAALRYGRKHDMKFVVRMMPDRSYRCWRVA